MVAQLCPPNLLMVTRSRISRPDRRCPRSHQSQRRAEKRPTTDRPCQRPDPVVERRKEDLLVTLLAFQLLQAPPSLQALVINPSRQRRAHRLQLRRQAKKPPPRRAPKRRTLRRRRKREEGRSASLNRRPSRPLALSSAFSLFPFPF